MDELATKLKAGGTPSRQNKANFGGDVPFVLIDDMTSSGVYLKSTKETITRGGLESCSAWIVPENTVLLSMYATIGATVITTFPVATNQAILAIIPREDCDREYLSFCLQAHKRHLARLNVESTQKNINKGIVSSFPLPLPPLPEQKKIAHILSTVQRAIEAQERIIQTTTELKKALMHKLFTEGLRQEPQKQTEIGPVPESWEVVPLGELVNFTTGKLNSNAAMEDGKYPFFTCSKETFWIDHYAFDTEAILLSGNNAQAIYSVKHYEGKFNAYQRTYVITVKETARISYRFLSQMLSRSLERLRTISIGSSTKYLTLGLLLNLPVAIPPCADGVKIGDWLTTTDQKIKEHEAKTKTLQDLFRTLLHELMTAKTRVHKLEINA
jgi:type I restriction enzyme S subunit